jgi:hypothetical protein
MTTATIAVKGSARDEFFADIATFHFNHQFTTQSRSEVLARGNAVVGELRESADRADTGVHEMKVRLLRVEEMYDFVGPDHIREQSGWTAQ